MGSDERMGFNKIGIATQCGRLDTCDECLVGWAILPLNRESRLPRYSQYRFALACVAMGWNCPCSCFFMFWSKAQLLAGWNFVLNILCFSFPFFLFSFFLVLMYPILVVLDGKGPSKVVCPLSCSANLPSPPFSCLAMNSFYFRGSRI